ncbi:hypothetical protein D8B22_20595 [Verminephrobacter aporrectodeae subsp. tuberculatae]|nr:hypothetical protein [Verminephrobacter aporrectodeae subsp. tuberculatae]MCW8171435.1 hypothetical protein [Verminephrobacter aporrectodeae subsp. tuberculatae]
MIRQADFETQQRTAIFTDKVENLIGDPRGNLDGVVSKNGSTFKAMGNIRQSITVFSSLCILSSPCHM